MVHLGTPKGGDQSLEAEVDQAEQQSGVGWGEQQQVGQGNPQGCSQWAALELSKKGVLGSPQWADKERNCLNSGEGLGPRGFPCLGAREGRLSRASLGHRWTYVCVFTLYHQQGHLSIS